MKQALDTRTKLLTKSPWPLMIELSIPAVLGMVLHGFIFIHVLRTFILTLYHDSGRIMCDTDGR